MLILKQIERYWYLVTLCLITSCVGVGKFKAMEADKAKMETDLSTEISHLQSEKIRIQSSEQELRDELIKQNLLLSSLLADKLNLEKEVSTLKQSMGQLSSESQTVQESLNQELQKKNASLQRKETILNQLIEKYQEYEIVLRKISSLLSEKLANYREDQIEWYLANLHLDIIFYNSFLFRKPRQLNSSATRAINELITILREYPSLQIVIEGHTDNDPKKEASALLNSALNASEVAQYLLDPGKINSNQITVSGRGGFAPRVSNQTPAGRVLNNRVEISVRVSPIEIYQMIKNQL